MIELGRFGLVMALMTGLYCLAASVAGARSTNDRMIKSGEYAMYSMLFLLTLSSISLMYAFLSRDFSLEYVYNYSNRDLPTLYTISSFWGGQAGSLLLWGWMLTFFGGIVVYQNRDKNRKLMPYVTATIAVTTLLFIFIMQFASSPFKPIGGPTPADGHGLNPLLQNPGMLFHPPTLYIGFVAFTIPFAFAIAALISNQLGDVWVRTTRRWTIFAWFSLTVGNLLGANWAYVELGWGGYWAWDPVENASFMPWLTGTAFLHSVMIQEKKDMLKIWNMALIVMTFCLTIFGTFITRSGLIQSVHAFGETTVGYYFLAFLFICIAISVYLIMARLPLLRSENKLDSMLSRESSFMFNNLLFVGMAFGIFFGTLFPMISEAVQGEKITVGPPYFNMVNTPIGLAILILTGICPLIAWRMASWANFRKNFLRPFSIAVIAGIIFAAMGITSLYAWIGSTSLVFVLSTILIEIFRATAARGATKNEAFHVALYNLFRRNNRRYGGYIIHIGVVFMFAGFTGQAFNVDVEKNVAKGEKIQIKDYTLTYLGNELTNPVPSVEKVIATLLVEKNGEKIGWVRPEKRFYKIQNQPTSEVAIHSTPKEDLYVIFAALNTDSTATFKIHINPLVFWLWVGGMVMGIGTIIAMLPENPGGRGKMDPATV